MIRTSTLIVYQGACTIQQTLFFVFTENVVWFSHLQKWGRTKQKSFLRMQKKFMCQFEWTQQKKKKMYSNHYLTFPSDHQEKRKRIGFSSLWLPFTLSWWLISAKQNLTKPFNSTSLFAYWWGLVLL